MEVEEGSTAQNFSRLAHERRRGRMDALIFYQYQLAQSIQALVEMMPIVSGEAGAEIHWVQLLLLQCSLPLISNTID